MAWTNTDILFISLICQGSEYSPNWLQTEAYPAWYFTWLHWLIPVSFILTACFSFVNVSTWVSHDYKSLWYLADSKETFIKNFFKIHSTESTGLLPALGHLIAIFL